MATGEVRGTQGTVVTVHAPGFVPMQEEAAAAPMAAAAADEALETAVPPEWVEAFAVNGVPLGNVEDIPALGFAAEAFAAEAAAPEAMLMRRGVPGPHVEIAARPREDHTALLMVQNGDLVQWFVPVNAPRVVPRHAKMRAELSADVAPQPLRFVVPSALMQQAAPPEGMAIAAEGFFGRVVSKIVHIPLVQDLIDAPVRWIIEHIAKTVESKTKSEGFKFFHDDGTTSDVSQEQMKAMTAQGRVLFLTHGVFSSLHGAFNSLEGTPTLAALRGKYKDRIIGWDHWTISKTPLENADEMLTRMAPLMDVDFICHSRGALVMRAALEHEDLREKRRTRFRESGVGSAMFVAGANQGSQLASFEHVNTLLNVYSAIGQLFGSVALEVVFAVLRVLAHGASKLPSVEALSSDPSNGFVRKLNDQPPMLVRGSLAVAHANFDPRGSALEALLNLNVDKIFGTANDLVVPFGGAATFDPNVIADRDLSFGNAADAQPTVSHTKFFEQDDVQTMIRDTFL